MESLAAQRVDLGLPCEMVTNADLAGVWPTASSVHSLWCSAQWPALAPRRSGQWIPCSAATIGPAIRALAEQSVELNATAVVHLERNDNHWRVHRADGDSSVHKWALCNGALHLAPRSEPLEHILLEQRFTPGQARPMTPVLGQALSLELTTGPTTWNNWPSVLVDQGFNLIPTAPGCGDCCSGPPWNRAIALRRIL